MTCAATCFSCLVAGALTLESKSLDMKSKLLVLFALMSYRMLLLLDLYFNQLTEIWFDCHCRISLVPSAQSNDLELASLHVSSIFSRLLAAHKD